MSRRFIVVARPRSRTSWLATFLNAAGVVCQHDIVDICPGPAAYKEALNVAEISGAVDTGAVLVLPEILEAIPDCVVAVIDRPWEDCEVDMFRMGVDVDLSVYEEPMQAAKQLPGVLTVGYDELGSETAIRMLWAHLVGTTFPKLWYEHCRWMHIELSKQFFAEEFPRRAKNPDPLRGWSLEHLKLRSMIT